MTRTLKVLSLLLAYPTREIAQAAGASFAPVLEAEGVLPAAARRALATLLGELAERDLYDNQERYVLLFDRTRSLSLHLFEHVHGESRDRGQAMVDLQALYAEHGLEMPARELPDYLPLFLEFLAVLPFAEARGHLGDVAAIVSALEERLRKRESPYAAVFGALGALAHAKADPADVAELLAGPDDDPQDLEAVDEVWEEAAVTFGPTPPGPDASAPCGPDRLAARIRAGSRPPPDAAAAGGVSGD